MPSINDVASIVFQQKTKYPISTISLKPIRFKVAKDDAGKVINLINSARGTGNCRVSHSFRDGFFSTRFIIIVDGDTAEASDFFNNLSKYAK